MAIQTNTLLSFNAIGNREDLIDTIFNIDPVEVPFQSSVGKSKANAVKHEWQTQALAAAAANAVIEGDDTMVSYTFTSPTLTSRLNNILQISRKDVVVAGTQDAVNKAGRTREIVYQMVLKNKELRRDVEFVLMNNQAPTARGSSTAGQLAPVVSWYSSNTSLGASGANSSLSSGIPSGARTDGTQRPLTESMMKSVIQSAWKAGGEIDTIMPGPFNKTVISTFSGNQTKTQDTSDKKLIAAIDVYVSDFGTHRIKPNRFSRERDLHLLDTDLWAVSYLRPVKAIDLAKTGDNEKGMLIVEYTLESRQEKGSGLVADLTTS